MSDEVACRDPRCRKTVDLGYAQLRWYRRQSGWDCGAHELTAQRLRVIQAVAEGNPPIISPVQLKWLIREGYLSLVDGARPAIAGKHNVRDFKRRRVVLAERGKQVAISHEETDSQKNHG